MEKRQDKYEENKQTPKMTRTERHKSLYNEINSKIGYSEVPSYESGTKIDLSSLNADKPKREEYQKIKEYKKIMDTDEEKQEYEEKKSAARVKNFDINAVLEEAKKNRKNEDELEKKRNLADSESVLSSLNKKYLHTKDFKEEDNDELKELIDTITSKTMIDDIKDEEEKELLSELLATTIDIKLEQELSNDEINKLYDEADSVEDNSDNEYTEDFTSDITEDYDDKSMTDKLDNSFFTHSVEIKKDDLIGDNESDSDEDEDEESDKNGIIKIVVVSIILLILVLLVTYFVLKQIGF
jgi:hypothetical protein